MAQEIGSAKAIQGHVSAVGPEGSRELSVGSPVFKGDTLSTAKGSGGSIQFLDKTVLNVGEGSKVSLDQYVYDAGKGSGQALFKMAQGTFRAVTGEIVKHNPESFKMQSPLATIGIRGTETAHTVPGPDQTDASESHLVMVFDGKPVIVQPLGGGAFQVLSQAGVKVEVGKFGAGPVMVMTPQEFKYFQALTATGLQQGVPQDTMTPQGQGQNNPAVQGAQNAAGKATAEAQAAAAAAEAAKAAAEAAAQAAAEAEASGDPEAQAAAEAAAKAAAAAAAQAEAAAKAAADAAAKAQAEAFAAQQALILAQQAQAAAQAAQDAQNAANQQSSMRLDPGSIISFSTSTDSSGNTTTVITVTPPAGSNTQPGTGTTPLIVSEAADEIIGGGEEEDDNDDDGDDGDTPVFVGKTLDLSEESMPATVNLADPNPWYMLGQPPSEPLDDDYVNVVGTMFEDNITGNESANNLVGGDGNDIISGMCGNDTISGGDGTDQLSGGSGNDVLLGGDNGDILDSGIGLDSLDGGEGDDGIFMGTELNNADGLDTIQGGEGIDTLNFIDNGAGTNDLDTTRGVENVFISDNASDADVNIVFPSNYTAADWAAIGGLLTVNAASVGGDSQSTVTFDGSSAAAYGKFVIDGGHHDDSLTGGAGNDTLRGNDGDDTLIGGAGNDSLVGGEGSNSLVGGEGNDTLVGSTGNDTFEGGKGADLLSGGGGNDTYVFRTGDLDAAKQMTMDGGDAIRAYGNVNFTTNGDPIGGFGKLEVAQDGSIVQMTTAQAASLTAISFTNPSGSSAEQVKFHATAGATSLNLSPLTITGVTACDRFYLYGNADANAFYGTAYADIISGGEGEDYLSGLAGNDSISGDADGDTIHGGLGDDTIIGGAGADTLLGDTTDTSDGGGNDTFIFNAGDVVENEVVSGGLGNTTFKLLASTDFTQSGVQVIVDKQAGVAHTIDLASGSTATFNWNSFKGLASGSVTILGTEGTAERIELVSFANGNTFRPDVFTYGQGMDANDILHFVGDSQSDPDIMDYSGISTNPISVTGTGDGAGTVLFGSQTHTFSGMEQIKGTEKADTINLTDSWTTDAVIYGGAGNDSITGGHGSDSLFGEGGDDVLYGGWGNDTLNGGAGNDTANYAALEAAVEVNLAAGTAQQNDYGEDVLVSIENVIGTAWDDILTGNNASNLLNGGAGNDNLNGGEGNDSITGGEGDDILVGGLGDDTLSYASETGTANGGGIIANYANGTLTITDTYGNLDTVSEFETLIATAANDLVTIDSESAPSDITSISLGDGVDTMRFATTVDMQMNAGEDPLHITGLDKVEFDTSSEDVTVVFNASDAHGQAWELNNLGADSATFKVQIGDSGNANLSCFTFGAGWDDSRDKVMILGREVGDTITGTSKADSITGNGGNDVLTGGSGSDLFIFNNADNGYKATITDFEGYFVHGANMANRDFLCFQTASTIFEPLGEGMAHNWWFDSNSSGYACSTTKATLVYDESTDILYYDADGSVNGSSNAIAVAQFSNDATLTAQDFNIQPLMS